MSINITSQVPATLNLLPLFHVCNAFYKAIDHQPIGVHVLIPRDRPSGKRPLLVRIHGGGFTEGMSDAWLNPWILELALKHGAILVAPDYRLRPEAQLSDIIDDMRDFWAWTQTSLPQLPGIEVDVSNLAVVGESAGGTLTAQTALLDMIRPIRVIILQYPVLDIASHLKWQESLPDAEKSPGSVLDHHLANTMPGHIVTRVPNGLRLALITSMIQNGRFADIDKDPWLDPIHSLDNASSLPPVFLFHGRQDTDVRIEDSESWAAKLKKLQPDVDLHFVARDGEHCFDQADTLATPWLREPIQFVEQYWPAKS